jgi:hypothetical protein
MNTPGDTKALAERWGISITNANKRKRSLNLNTRI